MAAGKPKKHPDMSLDDLSRIQPGLARLMPEVGTRTWKLWYAARAGNWPLAHFQAKEVRGLLELCGFTRPKYRDDLGSFLAEQWQPLLDAIEAEDFAAVDAAFQESVRAANAYHRVWKKPWIVWKLPDAPPPDLDLTPQKP